MNAAAPRRKIEASRRGSGTAHTRAETLENVEYSLTINADAIVISPLSIRDLESPVELVTRDVGAIFERAGKMLPVFLYDNADIAAPGKPLHLHTRDVKLMSQLPTCAASR